MTFSLALLIIFTITCYSSVGFINKSNKQLNEFLNFCTEAAENQEIEKLNKEYKELYDVWQQKKRVYNIILHKQYTEDIDKSIEIISVYIEEKDFEEIINKANECIHELDQITQRERISLENIL